MWLLPARVSQRCRATSGDQVGARRRRGTGTSALDAGRSRIGTWPRGLDDSPGGGVAALGHVSELASAGCATGWDGAWRAARIRRNHRSDRSGLCRDSGVRVGASSKSFAALAAVRVRSGLSWRSSRAAVCRVPAIRARTAPGRTSTVDRVCCDPRCTAATSRFRARSRACRRPARPSPSPADRRGEVEPQLSSHPAATANGRQWASLRPTTPVTISRTNRAFQAENGSPPTAAEYATVSTAPIPTQTA